MVLLQLASAVVFARRRFCEGHVGVQCCAQINFMLLFLHDDRAQGLA
jgi:hypothetical protein